MNKRRFQDIIPNLMRRDQAPGVAGQQKEKKVSRSKTTRHRAFKTSAVMARPRYTGRRLSPSHAHTVPTRTRIGTAKKQEMPANMLAE